MTKEEIIEMARKCGWDSPASNMAPFYNFAKLVAEKEREECAKIADDWHTENDAYMSPIAQAIRARGQE